MLHTGIDLPWGWWIGVTDKQTSDKPNQLCLQGYIHHATHTLMDLETSKELTGLEKVSFHSNPKEKQCKRMLKLPHSSHMLEKVMLKILQAKLQQ